MKIAVAIGDPNGIGPEIAVKAARRFIDSPVQPILVGDEQVLRHYGAEGKLHPVKSLEPEAFKPGTLDPRAGRATVEYIRAAVGMVRRGEADAIVACPQSETAINKAGIPFSGYAGLLAELTNTPKERTFLMLVAAGLRIAHVTLHESVQSALGRITAERVVEAGATAVAAVRRLGVANPSLGVFGINPHAGEDGLFGDEDERITKPAVAELRKRGIDAHGPGGADLLLSQRRHDVYLAMFHDQGHIPIKLVSPLRSSALSIGTPVLFSSVGHGCAYDIAGKNVADPASVIETLSLLGGTAP
ncbi:MAG TPA: 4-hydroxythreonine-4-phosphate dehydrogenase PdxA [Burkholderiales bacterium]|nr:4-hydroxythreonine-4-phosphate dehydrogenase PdxA [Burkholderiales bacterium]